LALFFIYILQVKLIEQDVARGVPNGSENIPKSLDADNADVRKL